MKSLYELKNMKAQNSIYKSVFITGETFEGRPVIEIEPYDNTFINAISTESKYDSTVDKILKRLHQFF